MTHIGGYIAQDRQRLGLSQAELARQLGVSQQSVSKWEEQRATPRGKRLTQLVRILGSNSLTASTVGATVSAPVTTAGQYMGQSSTPVTHTQALAALASAAQEIARAAKAIADSVALLAKQEEKQEPH